MGLLTIIGGYSSTKHGSPGTVWVNTTVGADVVTYLWSDHTNRGWGCERYPVYVDVKSINNFHPMRGACLHPSVVSDLLNISP